MSQISCDPADLVAQTKGCHHQYPDGLMLFLGTLFAPMEDRDTAGGGFTHKLGDVVTIASDGSERCVTPWSCRRAAPNRHFAPAI